MGERKQNVNAIVKFIQTVFHPSRIRIREIEGWENKEYYIVVYFDSISDEYITNWSHKDLVEHKESMMSREIRESVEKYLGIRTTGLQYMNNYFGPIEQHGISLIVVSEENI